MKKLSLLLIMTSLLFACSEEEEAIDAPVVNTSTPIETAGGGRFIQKGITVSQEVELGADYITQAWFDLGTNTLIQRNSRLAWDLAFDCDASKQFVYINYALTAEVASTNETDLKQVTSTTGLSFKTEHQSGALEKLAIGNISNNQRVYVLKRGYDAAGNELDVWKFQISQTTTNSYELKFAPLADTSFQTTIITKDPAYNRIYFSLLTEDILKIEPPKSEYDLVFTQYTFVFENPPIPYSVNGVLINSYNTEVAEEFNVKFENIDESHAESLSYTDELDVIGYEWKDFDFDQQLYNIDPNQNFIIRDSSGKLYLLRFLDFYDSNGIKGTPSFEYVRLK